MGVNNQFIENKDSLNEFYGSMKSQVLHIHLVHMGCRTHKEEHNSRNENSPRKHQHSFQKFFIGLENNLQQVDLMFLKGYLFIVLIHGHCDDWTKGQGQVWSI